MKKRPPHTFRRSSKPSASKSPALTTTTASSAPCAAESKGRPVPESFRVLIKEFQALGLDIQIINKDGSLKDIKELEKEEDKDDTPVSIEEIGKQDVEEESLEDESDYEDVQPEDEDEFDDEFDEEFNEDDDLDYKEEYGLDDFQEDAYERGEE